MVGWSADADVTGIECGLAAGASASGARCGRAAMIDATERSAYSSAAWSNAKRADAFIHNSDGRMERPVRREITLPGRGVKFADDLRCAVRWQTH